MTVWLTMRHCEPWFPTRRGNLSAQEIVTHLAQHKFVILLGDLKKFMDLA
jgi:hypothetical protein